MARSQRGGPACFCDVAEILIPCAFMTFNLARTRSLSSARMHCHPFSLRLTASGAKPQLDDDRVDGKSNPKCDAEEFAGCKAGKSAGSKEDSHHRPRCGNAKKDGDPPQQPSPLQKLLVPPHVPVCSEQREEKDAVKEQNRGALDPSADGVDAHRISGNTNDCSEREDEPLSPGCVPAENDEG